MVQEDVTVDTGPFAGTVTKKSISKKSNPVRVLTLRNDLDETVYFSATDVGVGEDTVAYLTNERTSVKYIMLSYWVSAITFRRWVLRKPF
jgi:hypothetical protein